MNLKQLNETGVELDCGMIYFYLVRDIGRPRVTIESKSTAHRTMHNHCADLNLNLSIPPFLLGHCFSSTNINNISLLLSITGEITFPHGRPITDRIWILVYLDVRTSQSFHTDINTGHVALHFERFSVAFSCSVLGSRRWVQPVIALTLARQLWCSEPYFDFVLSICSRCSYW